WKIIAPARVMYQPGVDQVGPQRRGQIARQGLIAEKNVMAAARRSNAADVQRIAHQLIQVARVLDVVANRQPMPVIKLMIDFDEAVVSISGLQDVEVFGSQSQVSLRSIDRGQGAHKSRRVGRRLRAPLSLVVHEEERLVPLDWAAQSRAELVLPERIRLRRGLEERSRVTGLVAQHN